MLLAADTQCACPHTQTHTLQSQSERLWQVWSLVGRVWNPATKISRWENTTCCQTGYRACQWARKGVCWKSVLQLLTLKGRLNLHPCPPALKSATTVVLKVVRGLGDPLGAFKGPGGHKYFHDNVKTCFSLFHECTVEISRGYPTCDNLIALRANGMYATGL